MAQNFSLPTGSTRANVAIKTNLAEALEALRTLHSGTTQPASIVADMLWMDTSTTPPVLKLRDTGNSAWISLFSAGGSLSTLIEASDIAGALSATGTDYFGPVPRAGTISKLILLSSAATTSTSGNEWQPQVTVYPFSDPSSPVTLFSAAVGTFTTLAGAPGGIEFVADKALVFVPDQNVAVSAYDVIELTMTLAGTPGALANFRAYVEVI
tara:strand:+ start:17983 stop:18615 length:633 start_codon:yes stop_codon:yes gene_type:complete